jgi:hypothetical protein
MNKKSLPYGGLFFMPNAKRLLKVLLLIKYFYCKNSDYVGLIFVAKS